MGFATHLGPWLLGTVKNTTGTTAGSIRNMGATIVAQTFTVSQADGTNALTVGSIPAGSLITSIQLITTTAFTSGTMSLSIGGTVINGSITLPTAVGTSAVSVAATTAAAAEVNNVGTIDSLVSYTLTTPVGAGAQTTMVIAYIVRNSDGAANPTSTQN
jgi:hypothetical protein